MLPMVVISTTSCLSSKERWRADGCSLQPCNLQSSAIMGSFSVLLRSAAASVLLQDTGQALPAALPTFFDIISNDEDTTLRSIVQITNGVTSIVDKVQTLLTYWEKKYKHMWDQDKEAYIRQVASGRAWARAAQQSA